MQKLKNLNVGLREYMRNILTDSIIQWHGYLSSIIINFFQKSIDIRVYDVVYF